MDKYDNGLWHIGETIGKGSFGKVCKITKDKKIAALKVITVLQEDSGTQRILLDGEDVGLNAECKGDIVQSVVNGVKSTSKFKKAFNIVSYEDCKAIKVEGEPGTNILLRMELLESLEKIAESKALSEVDVGEMGIDICSALELLENSKMIHGNIKPSNIFLSAYQDYKLGDLGIASSGLADRENCEYMSPEARKGQELEASDDLYSLGMIMYQIMNIGSLPCVSVKDGEAQPLAPPLRASKRMSDVILKACAHDRALRYQSAAEMAKDLRKTILIKVGNKPFSLSAKTVEVHGCKLKTDLIKLRLFPELATLIVTQCREKNIEPLSRLSKLVNLTIAESGAFDIGSLAGLRELNRLVLPGNGIKSLSPLAGLRNLEILDLSENKISDLKPLSALTQLSILNLSLNRISNASPLSQLANLKSLHLSENQITGLGFLKEMKNLTKLGLSSNKIKELGTLPELESLTSLDLNSNQLTDVSALSSFKNLAVLYLAGNKISDISALSELRKLASLNLRENQITDVSRLSGLSKLTSLDLSDNKITDVSQLSGLSKLVSLNLAGNNIKDVRPLSGLRKLSWLDLSLCPIEDLSQLSELTSLTELSCSFTRFMDLNGLRRFSKLVNLVHIDFRDSFKPLPWDEYAAIRGVLPNCRISF
jgi:internalin A